MIHTISLIQGMVLRRRSAIIFSGHDSLRNKRESRHLMTNPRTPNTPSTTYTIYNPRLSSSSYWGTPLHGETNSDLSVQYEIRVDTHSGQIQLSGSLIFSLHVEAKLIQQQCFDHYGAETPIKDIPFPMVIGNHSMTIFGKDCHIWNTALLSLLSSVWRVCDLDRI